MPSGSVPGWRPTNGANTWASMPRTTDAMSAIAPPAEMTNQSRSSSLLPGEFDTLHQGRATYHPLSLPRNTYFYRR